MEDSKRGASKRGVVANKYQQVPKSGVELR